MKAGYSLQLGLLGLIAKEGGFAMQGVAKGTGISVFEYWKLSTRSEPKLRFNPVPRRSGRQRGKVATDDFVGLVADYFDNAAARWLTGEEPFIARPHSDAPVFTDYDQLMRLDEWIARGGRGDRRQWLSARPSATQIGSGPRVAPRARMAPAQCLGRHGQDACALRAGAAAAAVRRGARAHPLPHLHQGGRGGNGERVRGTLARWVQVDEAALFDDLEALGEASGPGGASQGTIACFAKVLDATGGGLRIQTIHSLLPVAARLLFPWRPGLFPASAAR